MAKKGKKKAKTVKDNPSKNMSATGYLRAFTKEMKEKDGKEPTLQDFNDALEILCSPEIIELCGIHASVMQVEVGTNGTMHLQLYLQLVKKMRRSTFNNLIRKHTPFNFSLQNSRGTADENVTYCTKQTGLWEYSSGLQKMNTTLSPKPIWINKVGLVKKGSKTNIQAAVRAIENGGVQNMRDVDVKFGGLAVRNGRGLENYMFRKKNAEMKSERLGINIVLYGPEGTGKSWEARHNISKMLGLSSDDVFQLNWDGNIWFDGYAGEKILLVDDYEPNGIKRSYLLRMTDIYPFHGQIKGGHIVAEWDYVIFTSNHDITELFVKSEEHTWINERGFKEYEMIISPDKAMYSRLTSAVNYAGRPDRRRVGGLYRAIHANDLSEASLLPDSLEHGTICDCSSVQCGCRGTAPPAGGPPIIGETTLEQFANSGTTLEQLEDEA